MMRRTLILILALLLIDRGKFRLGMDVHIVEAIIRTGEETRNPRKAEKNQLKRLQTLIQRLSVNAH